jgi:hypothetical protein
MSYKTITHMVLLTSLAMPAAALEVSARLDAFRIPFGGTVRLILETDSQPETIPDLTPLQGDFRIVGRSSSRQIKEVNDQRYEHHELRLTLSPLRSGHLQIPAIDFGEASTQPLLLEVTASTDGGAPEAKPTSPAWSRPEQHLPRASGSTNQPLPLPSPSSSPSPPKEQIPPGSPTPSPTIAPAEKPFRPEADTRPWWSWMQANWPMMTIGLIIFGSLGLGWSWRRHRHPSAPRAYTQPPPLNSLPREAVTNAPVDDLVAAIAAVTRAYADGDAVTARTALLSWASMAMPDQPPANLALLAKRCREPLRSDILLLEKTFYSPSPIDWHQQPVGELLINFAPLPPEQPASFRQGKPLRRSVTHIQPDQEDRKSR